jgi:hypothetical protein
MLEFATLAIMLIVAYSYFREGVLTALTTLVNVFVAGLIAFNFFEPLAEQLETSMPAFLEGYEDAICLFGLFIAPLAGLRWLTNNLANQEIELPALVQQFGAAGTGLLTGYLLAGFLFCMLQTLPWSERFMGFNYQVSKEEAGFRKFVPPDRVWLALMNRAGAPLNGPFSQEESTAFDPEGTFEIRYGTKRRVKDQDAKPAQ